MINSSPKQKQLINALIILSALFIINYLTQFLSFRIDLTEEKRFTLNNSSIELLKNLEHPLEIRVYLQGTMPAPFKRLKRELESQLQQYKQLAGKNIRFEFINPTEKSNQEERFKLYKYLYELGITPIEIKEEGLEKSSETMVFPAAVVVYGDKKLGVNLLQSDYRYLAGSEENINQSIQALEYELTNSIRKIIRSKTDKIAFIEGHGELSETELLSISSSLAEYYQIDRGSLIGQLGQLDDYKALLIASPIYPFNNEEKYVLDQYIMQGGSVLFLLEGVNVRMDSLNNQTTTLAMPLSVNLDDLVFRYGLRINADLVEDLRSSRIGLSTIGYNNQTEIKWFPWYFFPMLVSQNNHPINKYIDLIRTEFISTIDTVNKTPGIKKTVLLETSPMSKISATPLPISFQDINIPPDKNRFTHKPLPVAVLLEGKFSSLFENRMAPVEKQGFTKATISKNAKIIVISDGDIIRNLVSPEAKPYPLGFDRYSQQIYKGNTQFLLNAINYLAEDESFMYTRNREIKLRPMDKKKIAEQKFFWQFLNVGLPIILLIIIGIAFQWGRKRKYARQL
jgi:ABC-2 type transport system permease protein